MISREVLPTFPTGPGVYLMKGTGGKIVYVGKAKNLRRRLSSYFQNKERLPGKVQVMMTKVQSIDFLCTATEKEALLLEASLIKKHRPKYNIVLRDDKQYILFCMDRNHPFPALRLTRTVKRNGSIYFGPFTSALSARETKKVIDRLFPLRKCRDTVFRNRVRPCLQYHLGRCLGPCCLPVSTEEYAAVVRRVELFLSGKSAELLASLKTEMLAASEQLAFEQAARLRDSIKALQETIERQAAVLSTVRDVDVIGVHAHGTGSSLAIIFVRQGRIIDGRSFWFGGVRIEDPQDEIQLTDSFLSQFYTQDRFIPQRIVTALGSHDPALHDVLSDLSKTKVVVAKARGEQERRLVEIATANARSDQRGVHRQNVDLQVLARVLQLDVAPERIECIDASHLHGQGMRVGQVVFIHGLEEKSAYRLYTFPALEGQADDYLALASFVERRLASGPPWPDLLLIDGGKGQLRAVEQALKECGQENLFSLVAIAQSGSRRAGELEDLVFRPGRKNPLPIKAGSRELLFLQHVRDTAHRFVLSRLRQHARGQQLNSKLEMLPGIGPSTAKLLWDHFGSMEAMTNASLQDLQTLPGIGPKKARLLHEQLQKL